MSNYMSRELYFTKQNNAVELFYIEVYQCIKGENRIKSNTSHITQKEMSNKQAHPYKAHVFLKHYDGCLVQAYIKVFVVTIWLNFADRISDMDWTREYWASLVVLLFWLYEQIIYTLI